jgi:F-type H+-transporting ATPase subunit delta
MSVSVVAQRYAGALLELGVEEGNLDVVVKDVGALAQAWRDSPELRNAIENPLVDLPTKKAVLGDVAAALGACAGARSVALLLVDRRRARALPYIAEALRGLADAHRGVVRARVTAAAPLPEPYYAKLQGQLERLTGKRVVVERDIDASLIGGVVTRIGDRIFDGSVRTRLQSLRDALLPTV